MLPSSCRHLAILAHLGPILEATWPNLSRLGAVWGPSWAPRGRGFRVIRPGLAECAGPLDLQSRLLTDRYLTLASFYHGRPRGGRIQSAPRIPPGLFCGLAGGLDFFPEWAEAQGSRCRRGPLGPSTDPESLKARRILF